VDSEVDTGFHLFFCGREEPVSRGLNKEKESKVGQGNLAGVGKKINVEKIRTGLIEQIWVGNSEMQEKSECN
jgi:hypothetical protein